MEEEEAAANCWAFMAQQSVSAGNVHHSAARAPSLLYSQAVSSTGRDKGPQLQCGRKPSRGSRKSWAKQLWITSVPSSSTDSLPPHPSRLRRKANALCPFGPRRRADGIAVPGVSRLNCWSG